MGDSSADLAVPTTNRAFVLHGVDDVAFEDRAVPSKSDLKPTEVLVASRKTGICGSDVHYLKHGRISTYVVKEPMILGHETAGVVVACGADVEGLKEGDRVALEPGEGCRTCSECKRGHYELCPKMIFAATPPVDGTLAGFYKLPGDLAYKLPDNVTLEEGSLLEPLSVAVQAVSAVAQLKASTNVCVFGAGPVGLLAMATCRALGARRVFAVDVQEERLKFAGAYVGAEWYTPPKKDEGEEQTAYAQRSAEAMRERFGLGLRGIEGVDVVIECTGAEVCIQTSVHLLKYGGKHVQVGMGAEHANVPISLVLNKELLLTGSFRYGPSAYPLAIDLVSRGLVKLKPLITHRYAFEDAAKAFETTQKGKGEDGKTAIKTVIDGPK